MNETTRLKLMAAGKVALGAGRIVSGFATATGHGLLGGLCRQHHMMAQAIHIGRRSAEGGFEMLKEGVADWQDASR